MYDKREGGDDREQQPQRPGINVHGVFAGTASAVGEGIGKLHGFHAVDAQDGLNHKQPQQQPEAEEDAFRQQKGL